MSTGAEVPSLAGAIAAEEQGLLACVHCGFCLPECPTYTRLGDENDSPRGRLYLMRAVAEGRLDPASEAFQTHIDRCLGCRACEPVCPSGVPYGNLLELARSEAAEARPPHLLTRVLLGVFASDRLSRWVLAVGRLLRATRLPGLLVRLLPRRPGRPGRARFGLAMLAASAPTRWAAEVGRGTPGAATGDPPGPGNAAGRTIEGPSGSTSNGPSEPAPLRAALLRGCVQAGLFAHVNDATERVLRAGGVTPAAVPGQGCCGALHAHGGDLERARSLARRNVDAFEDSGADVIVVNAAGCGAQMKGYGHLLADDPAYARRAAELAGRVRDVSEVLADGRLRRGAFLPLRVALDHPCHLLHAQSVSEAPRRTLDAVPGLDVVEPDGAAECCGGAGIYGITHPDLGGRIGGDKVRAVLQCGADAVATANPGCIMQIGAGLRSGGEAVPVVHPVELLDESYRRAGIYDAPAESAPGGPARPAGPAGVVTE